MIEHKAVAKLSKVLSRIFAGAVLRFLLLSGWAVPGSASAQSVSDYAELLRRVDATVTFTGYDLSAEYTIEKRDPGGAVSTTVATMFRRDASGQFLILILEPAIDKGKGYLKIDDNLWLYDPVDRIFTFTSAKERFQNSSFRNSDFNRSNFSGDYRAV
ncbi:MAG: outer membrane lipoprotein-sorting protein, partial [Spirochaetales bacterium]|nr:outer membrane lipoprotein-sorting protein [Spirochaetales bacterium]